MRLPIPVEINNVLYVDAEVQAPTLDCLTETRKIAEDGRFFQSMRVFSNGCIKSVTTDSGQIIEDQIALKSVITKTPYKTIEHLAIRSLMVHNDDDDGVEGYYPCPRCGKESISEYRNDDGVIIDTRDHISSLSVGYFDPYNDNREITVVLTEPVIIKDRGNNDVFLEIKDFTVEIPTLEQCIVAESKVGNSDPIKLQLAIYVEAMKKVNGEKIDNKFKNEFGLFFLGKIRTAKTDFGKLAESINKYGLNRTVEKTCVKCGKVWRPTINTSNFFGSAPLTS